MAEDFLDTLRANQSAVLIHVVRQAESSPAFELIHWTVQRLSDQGIRNPDSLFLFSGEGRDAQGTRRWSVVLKIIKQWEDEDSDVSNMWYPKREYLAAESGLLEQLPPSVVAPRFYHITEHKDSTWLWMEYIVASTGKHWTTDHYAFTARKLGQFNGAYLTRTPLPNYPWLCKGQARTWIETWPPTNIWDRPYISQYITAHSQERVMQLWDERELFLETLERLPQVFSHLDFQRRNLFIRQTQDGSPEVVAIDWALCGHASIGCDLFMLLGASAALFELDQAVLPEVEKAVLEAYMMGLHDAGWNGSPEFVRLGYTAWFALWTGLASPALIARWTSDERVTRIPQAFGRSVDQFISECVARCEYGLDQADEARRIMKHLM